MRSLTKRSMLAIGVGLLAISTGRPASAVSIIPMTMQDSINQSAAIFTGHVLQAQSRWGTAEQRWMATDYLFQVDDAILPNGDVQKGAKVVLTWPGGTINGFSQHLAGMAMPKVGNTYTLMLRSNWTEPKLGPEVRLNHGLFQVVKDETGALQIKQAEGQPLVKLPNGMIVRDWEAGKTPGVIKGVSYSDFASWTRANLEKIKALPYTEPALANPSDPHELKPINVSVDVNAPIIRHRVEVPASEVKAPNSNVDLKSVAFAEPAVKPTGDNKVSGSPAPSETGKASVSNTFEQIIDKNFGTNTGYQTQWRRFNSIPGFRLNIVWNQFPESGFGGWEFQDQQEMIKQNFYSDIHRVRADGGTGTWAGGNGRYDMDGWPSSAQMNSQYGSGWGAGVLAVCWTYSDAFGITESDIAFNPAYGWTLDNEWIYDNGGSAWPFESTMMHEMCHSWGLDHSFDFLTIMNYQQRYFRAAPWQYMDDAEGMRATYGGPNHQSLAMYWYESTLDSSWSDFNAAPSTTIIAGNNITVDGYQIECLGNVNLPDTPISYYIDPARAWSSGEIHIGDANFGALNRFHYFTPSLVDRTFTIPLGTPAGYYYMASYQWTYGDVPGNERWPWNQRDAWSRTQIYVQPRISSIVVSPTISPRNSTATGTVYLYGKSDGRWVTLSSSNTTVAQVPNQVWVAAGDTSASFNVAIPNGGTAGNATITASLLGYSKTDVAYVVPRTTITSVNFTGQFGQTLSLYGTLKNAYNSAYVANEYLYFYLDGNYIGAALTNTSGKATLKYKVDTGLALGNHQLFIEHLTNYSWYYSNTFKVLSVIKGSTKLTVTNLTVPFAKNVYIKATLKRSADSQALVGYTVALSYDGTALGNFVTNATGVAQVLHKFDDKPLGVYPINASFAGSGWYNASTGAGTATVVQSPTAITIRSVAGARGTTVVLSAYLKRTSDGAYLNGRTLHFYVDGSFVGNGVMVSNLAKCNFTIPATMAVGSHSIRCDYDGETNYAASTKTGATSLSVK